MEAEQILTVLKLTQPLATIEHARVVESYAKDRGLTPFAEFSAIFTERKEKRSGKWIVTGIKGLTFKDHYSVQNRWSQKSGGYSVPFRETVCDVRRPTGYTDDNGNEKFEIGVEVTVGVITNRDYAALAAMATARIPDWNYEIERKAFMHFATGFCANSHKPPAGWTIQDVARKRAEETALKKAFGKEPSQSRELYAGAFALEQHQEAANALYSPRPMAALPAPESAIINGDYTDEAEVVERENLTGETGPFDDDKLDTDITHADEVVKAFDSPEKAIAWGVAQGAFGHGAAAGPLARNAYNDLKDAAKPASAEAMAALWRADVAQRLTEKEAEYPLKDE